MLILINILLLNLVPFDQSSIPASNTPHQVANEFFHLLTQMDTLSSKEFVQHFIPLHEIKSIAMDTTVKIKPSLREQLLSITPQQLHKRNVDIYNGLKRAGLELHIDWKHITFTSFKSKIDPVHKLEHYGELVFKSNDNYFEVQISTIPNGSNYFLADIESIREHRK